MEIKWHDKDPDTGQRRYLCAERFAGVWRFRWKLERRGEWTRGLEPTRAMWEHLLESLERRYRRREGVDDKDIEQVAKIVRELPESEENADDFGAGEAIDPPKGRAEALRIYAPANAVPQTARVEGFTPSEITACQKLIALAIEEDLGPGDVTSQAVIAEDLIGRAVFVARRPGVLAGLPAAALVVQSIEPNLRFEPLLTDGSALTPGQRLATLAGPMRGILACERIALNFLQHLSGVASLTRKYVDAVAGLPAKILDTRKTLPGWRLLQKYAVRCGGGHNHRMGLFDGILIKDNHLAAYPAADPRSRIVRAMRLAQESQPASVEDPGWLPVEVEVESLDQLDTALSCRPDIILLDNMTPETMREAVQRRDQRVPDVELEASGGITLASVRAIAETGVDRISVGALTHSAPALDIALDYEN
jgi:nicotinate-nucleotide pyrophosphorylase (carboxylating)